MSTGIHFKHKVKVVTYSTVVESIFIHYAKNCPSYGEIEGAPIYVNKSTPSSNIQQTLKSQHCHMHLSIKTSELQDFRAPRPSGNRSSAGDDRL